MQLEKQKGSLEEKCIFDKIETDLYNKYKAKFHAEIRQIEKQLSSAPIKNSNLEKSAKKQLLFAWIPHHVGF